MLNKRIISVFMLVGFVFLNNDTNSQNEVQKLYEAGKFIKCIKTCDKNISERINKKQAYLYKSLSLIDAYTDKKVLKLYPKPVYEALKALKKIESYKQKDPHDSFYSGNIRKIKLIKTKSTEIADILSDKKDFKSALKIYRTLFVIYPEEKVYVFKLLKLADFNIQVVLKQINDYSINNLYSDIYKVISNSKVYMPDNGKTELENGLEILCQKENCDLEIASMMLVFLKQNYNSSTKVDDLVEKYQSKYWQIDMLMKVNEKRKSGYTCGSKNIKSNPPLVLDICLTRTCQKYAELCAKEYHFSHTGPDGKSPWTRASEEGCYADGENIARGGRSVDDALDLWMNSPGHCENIMGRHTFMGIGESGFYWVQMFR